MKQIYLIMTLNYITAYAAINLVLTEDDFPSYYGKEDEFPTAAREKCLLQWWYNAMPRVLCHARVAFFWACWGDLQNQR